MGRINKQELIKIGSVTLVGLLALTLIIFWLKGHKIHNYAEYTFYFKNVNGLEEGNALRWNGLKIGVVDSISAVKESFDQPPLPSSELIELGKRHLRQAYLMLNSQKLEDLLAAQDEINRAQMEMALGRVSADQSQITVGDYVQVKVVVTKADIPIGALSQVAIVPSGVIGEQYVDLTSINIDDEFLKSYEYIGARFIALEPIRLDTLIKANVESAEAITNLVNRLNALFGDEDAENIKEMIDSLAKISGDPKFRKDVREAAANINKLTKDFKIWKLL